MKRTRQRVGDGAVRADGAAVARVFHSLVVRNIGALIIHFDSDAEMAEQGGWLDGERFGGMRAARGLHTSERASESAKNTKFHS